MYRVSVEDHFSSAHQLRGYDGPCENLHGHNWTVRIEVEAEELDSLGMVIDFKKLKRIVDQVVKRLDHAMINEVTPFDRVNPTSENIAAEIFRLLREELAFENGRLVEVELWETRSDMVRYRES